MFVYMKIIVLDFIRFRVLVFRRDRFFGCSGIGNIYVKSREEGSWKRGFVFYFGFKCF